jgi:hypothetical protein
MKFAADRPFASPEAAARKIVEIANTVEPVQDGRIYIEKINGPFLYEFKGSSEEYGAGIQLAIERAGSGCTRAVARRAPTRAPACSEPQISFSSSDILA